MAIESAACIQRLAHSQNGRYPHPFKQDDLLVNGFDDDARDGRCIGHILVGGSTPSAPAVSRFADWLFLAVRGNDNGIYWKNVNGASWHKLSGSTLSSPAISVIQDNAGTGMYVVVRGMDNGIYWCRVNALYYTQEPWHKLSGATNDSPSMFTDSASLYMYIAVRGISNGIYWCTVDLLSVAFWQSPWHGITGSTLSGPAIAFTDWLTVAVRGSDNGTYVQNVRIMDNHQPGWNVLPGKTPSGPAMTYGAGLLHFCVRGTDNGIYWIRT